MNHDPRISIQGSSGLLVQTELAAQLAQSIPETKLLDPTNLLVRWTLENCNRLSLAGFDPPTPFRLFYEWKNIVPFQHQIRTAEFITAHLRCGVWNQQGTGKSHAAIGAIRYLIQRGKIRRALVVGPISVMRSAWQNDLSVGAPDLAAAIAHGTADKRKKVIASDAQVVIINPDGVHIVVDQLAKGGFDLIIIDEATAYQDTSTRRYKALAKLIEPHTRVVLMTGTPASQSPVHAFGLGRLLGTAPKYKQDWEALVMIKQSRFVSIPKIDAAQHVQRILTPSIRFTKEQCLDLPEQTFCNRDVDMSPEQKKLYDTLKKEMVAEVEGGKITAANAAVLLGRLLQVSSGAVYRPDKSVVSLNAEPRYEALMDIINGTERKVIIFCNFRSSIQAISERLTKEGIDNDVIHGGVSANDRSSLIFRFQNMPSLRVLVLQTAAAAHGITLTAADTVVWWGPPMSVELYKQANDRPHRIGQKHNVTVYHLLSSYAERKVFTSLRQNISVHEAIVSLFSDVARN